MSSLIAQILEIASQRGLRQKDVAAAANLHTETLSRAKKRGSASLDLVEAIAAAAGVRLSIAPSLPQPRDCPPPSSSFADRNRWLAWSNPDAPVDLLLRRALVSGDFQAILDASAELGLDRVTQEWLAMAGDADPTVKKIAPVTERVLRNIRAGFEQASA